MSDQNNTPEYFHTLGVKVPKGYKWLLEQGIAGFTPFSQLQPWYYLKSDEITIVTERWPHGAFNGILVSFARRQDDDTHACFGMQNGIVISVVEINAWTGNGYEILREYSTFWNWLASVIRDISDWVEGDF